MVSPLSSLATRWFTPVADTPGARPALVCLPHAGAGASVFGDWQAHTDALDVLAVRLPGRESRVGEAAFDRMDDLLDAFVPALVPIAERGCVLFGHSMGALIAYEAARRLVGGGLPAPRRLVVSGCVPPHLLRHERMQALSDDQLIRWLVDINGVEEEVLGYPKLLELMLPTVRADMRLIDDYRHRDGLMLDIPVRVLCGTADPGAPVEQARRWRELTTGAFDLDVFAGDHFFFREHISRILPTIETDMGR